MYLTIDNPAANHDGIGKALGHKMGVFYADDVMIGSGDPIWIQGYINVLIDLFRIIVPEANIAKSKKMICQPGSIQSGMLVEAFTRRITGEGTNYPTT